LLFAASLHGLVSLLLILLHALTLFVLRALLSLSAALIFTLAAGGKEEAGDLRLTKN
jgi:hypothetical protein